MDGFGRRLDPFSGEGEREFHTGVDISAPTGTAVKVTADGIVTLAQFTTGGYGRMVVVDHGGGLRDLLRAPLADLRSGGPERAPRRDGRRGGQHRAALRRRTCTTKCASGAAR